MVTGIFIFIVVLVIGLLSIPLTLKFEVQRQQQFQGKVYMRWLFGYVQSSINLPMAKSDKPKREENQKKKAKRSAKKGRPLRAFMAVMKLKRFRQRIGRLLRELLRALHIHDLKLNAQIGLGDPADTGRLWAVMGPISSILASLQHASIRIEPEFMDEVLGIDGQGAMRLIPIQFLYIGLAFLLSPASLQAFYVWQKANRV